jgi:hypothetical protein
MLVHAIFIHKYGNKMMFLQDPLYFVVQKYIDVYFECESL